MRQATAWGYDMTADHSAAPMTPDSEARASGYAWYALGLMFVVYVLNFIDRQILSILAEDIKRDLGLTDVDLGFLFGTAFAVFYGVFGIPIGRLVDEWRRGWLMAMGLALWSSMTALSGLATNYTQLAIGRILRDHRTRADGRLRADGDRRHQRRVGTDERAVANRRRRFVHPVVVAGDGTGADVHACADDGIAEVREVVGLAADAELRVLGLDEVAHVHAVREHRARAQPRVRPDHHRAFGARAVKVAMRTHFRAGAEVDVLQPAERADAHAVTKHDRAFEHDVDVDLDIAAHAHVAAHVDARNVREARAGHAQRAHHAQLERAFAA